MLLNRAVGDYRYGHYGHYSRERSGMLSGHRNRVLLAKTEIKPQGRWDEITDHFACHAEEVEFNPGGNREPLT